MKVERFFTPTDRATYPSNTMELSEPLWSIYEIL